MLLKGSYLNSMIAGAIPRRGIGRRPRRFLVEHSGRVAMLDLEEHAAIAAAVSLGHHPIGLACNASYAALHMMAARYVPYAFGPADMVGNKPDVRRPLKVMGIKSNGAKAIALLLRSGVMPIFH